MNYEYQPHDSIYLKMLENAKKSIGNRKQVSGCLGWDQGMGRARERTQDILAISGYVHDLDWNDNFIGLCQTISNYVL